MNPSADPSSPSDPPAVETPTAPRCAPTRPVSRAYPWLLFLSTTVAAAFCLLYITKPVIVPPAEARHVNLADLTKNAKLQAPRPDPAAPPAALMPNSDRLPGDPQAAVGTGTHPAPSNPRVALPGRTPSAFEETNLRIQHILTAEAPSGHLDRLDIDVPVLYQSRSLRWTTRETAEARNLLAQLIDYQEKSIQLRAEGAKLLESWNHLINNSIPATDLRADSPSLPANQQDAANSPLPGGMSTTESIQIKPPAK